MITASEILIDFVDWITCPRCRVMQPLGEARGCQQCRKSPPT
jgi:hypothetical protein